MKLAQGDTVIVLLSSPSNGSNTAPAIVNRVWGEGDTRDAAQMVNCIAFPDNGGTLVMSSVAIHQKPTTGYNVGWLRERDALADVHPALAAAG